jgi:hypothetical protein
MHAPHDASLCCAARTRGNTLHNLYDLYDEYPYMTILICANEPVNALLPPVWPCATEAEVKLLAGIFLDAIKDSMFVAKRLTLLCLISDT